MTPGQIIALVRDALLIAGVGFVVWWVWHDGKNTVKVQDMAAVQQQLTANATQESAWHSQADAAEAQHARDLDTINAAISAHNTPIVVRVATSPSAVPSASIATAGQPAASRPTDDGPGVNIRAGLSAFERQYEGVLADCREAIAQWP